MQIPSTKQISSALLLIALLSLGCFVRSVHAAGAELPLDVATACSSDKTIKVKGTVRLQPNCVYNALVVIKESASELDCQGSIIDAGAIKGNAIHVESDGKPLSDVTVRNCVIRNPNGIGILISWRKPDRDKAESMSREELYKRSPARVQILNTRVEGASSAGIFVDDYVSQVTLSRVTVCQSKSMAVYLEHSSRNVTIEDSLFEDNSTGAKREAIAIDSSADNVVRGNVFRRNNAGGIFLYKNCGEHAHTDPRQVARWQGADRNVIEGNLFEDEAVGVWIAARQSRNVRGFDCMDEYYGDGMYVRDRAQHNTVRNNVFRNAVKGVIVEDDGNAVTGNRFDRIHEVCVRVGTEHRSRLLGLPVRDVTLAQNDCSLQRGQGSGIEFLYGSKP